jgi:hypothetical protein
MNGQQQKKQDPGVRDQDIRAALDQHWAASDANDFVMEHLSYREDAALEYPQSGGLTRGRSNIQGQRESQPNKKRIFYPANHWDRWSLGHRIHPHI